MIDNKINKRFLDAHLSLSALYEIVSLYGEEETEENLKVVSERVEELNRSMDALSNTLKIIIEQSAGIETEEIDAIPTENGMKL
jgi:hypothetical protein